MQCPVCGYAKCYQQRGFCRCGAYLISITTIKSRSIPVCHPEKTWMLLSGEWLKYTDWLALPPDHRRAP
jgi:hypothetical protein